MNGPIRLVMPAKHFHDGDTVTKATGQAEFTFREKVMLYSESGKEVLAPGGDMRYLVSDNGDINAIAADKQLAIHFEDPEQLSNYVEMVLCEWENQWGQ